MKTKAKSMRIPPKDDMMHRWGNSTLRMDSGGAYSWDSATGPRNAFGGTAAGTAPIDISGVPNTTTGAAAGVPPTTPPAADPAAAAMAKAAHTERSLAAAAMSPKFGLPGLMAMPGGLQLRDGGEYQMASGGDRATDRWLFNPRPTLPAQSPLPSPLPPQSPIPDWYRWSGHADAGTNTLRMADGGEIEDRALITPGYTRVKNGVEYVPRTLRSMSYDAEAGRGFVNPAPVRMADGGIPSWMPNIFKSGNQRFAEFQAAQGAPQAAPPPVPVPVAPAPQTAAPLVRGFVDPKNALQAREQAAGLHTGGYVNGMGGRVPGEPTGDRHKALYEGGEFVVSNAMLKKAPGLREELHALREETLEGQGKTVAEADAEQVKGGRLRAQSGGLPPLPDLDLRNVGPQPLPASTVAMDKIAAQRAAALQPPPSALQSGAGMAPPQLRAGAVPPDQARAFQAIGEGLRLERERAASLAKVNAPAQVSGSTPPVASGTDAHLADFYKSYEARNPLPSGSPATSVPPAVPAPAATPSAFDAEVRAANAARAATRAATRAAAPAAAAPAAPMMDNVIPEAPAAVDKRNFLRRGAENAWGATKGVRNFVKSTGPVIAAGAAGAAAANFARDIGNPDREPEGNAQPNPLAAQIPTGGVPGAGPTAKVQPYNFFEDTETGRNIGNLTNAVAAIPGAQTLRAGVPFKVGSAAERALKVAPVVEAAAQGAGAQIRSDRTNTPSPAPAASPKTAPVTDAGPIGPEEPPNAIRVTRQANGNLSFSGDNIGQSTGGLTPGDKGNSYIGHASAGLRSNPIGVMPAMDPGLIKSTLTNPDGSGWTAADNARMAANLRDGNDPYRGTSRQAGEDAGRAQADLERLAASPLGTPGRTNAMQQLTNKRNNETVRRGQDIEYQRAMAPLQMTMRRLQYQSDLMKRFTDPKTGQPDRERVALELEKAGLEPEATAIRAGLTSDQARDTARETAVQGKEDAVRKHFADILGKPNKDTGVMEADPFAGAEAYRQMIRAYPNFSTLGAKERATAMAEAETMARLTAASRANQNKGLLTRMGVLPADLPHAPLDAPTLRNGEIEKRGFFAGHLFGGQHHGDPLLTQGDNTPERNFRGANEEDIRWLKEQKKGLRN